MAKKFSVAVVLVLLASVLVTSAAYAGNDDPPPPYKFSIPLLTCQTRTVSDPVYGTYYAGTHRFWIDRLDLQAILDLQRNHHFSDVTHSDFYKVTGPAFDWLGRHQWAWWYWAPGEYYGSCESRRENPPLVEDLALGKEYDLYHGECGVYVPASTTVATATLSKLSTSNPKGLDMAQRACNLEILNNEGAAISNFGGALNYYVQLDKWQYQDWLDGDLGLYIHDGTSWSACSAMLVGADPDNEYYGRLACMSTTVGAFALGYK